MKFLALILAPAVLAAALSVTATYNDTVSGSQTAAPESEGIALNLTAAGELPGMNKLTACSIRNKRHRRYLDHDGFAGQC